MQDDPLFVSPLEAARLLGLSRSEVYRLLDAERIQSFRHGSRRLVVLKDLYRYADEQVPQAAEAQGA